MMIENGHAGPAMIALGPPNKGLVLAVHLGRAQRGPALRSTSPWRWAGWPYAKQDQTGGANEHEAHAGPLSSGELATPGAGPACPRPHERDATARPTAART
jgi:hypothetical protein